MRNIIAGGAAGLLLGVAIQLCGLSDTANVRGFLACSRRGMLRTLLLAAGLTSLAAALLGWLAVIDVDLLSAVPLSGGVILGGVIFGAAAAWAGMTPATALAGIGGGRFAESLCAVLGCMAGGACLPFIESLADPIRSLIPNIGGTWFRVTLDQPYVFAGGFLGLGCIGLLLTVLSLCFRSARQDEIPQEAISEDAPAAEAAEADEHAVSTEPADVQDDAFVVNLPGEEAVVVDTAEPENEADSQLPAVDQAPPESQDSAEAILPGEEPRLVSPAEPGMGDAAQNTALETATTMPPPSPDMPEAEALTSVDEEARTADAEDGVPQREDMDEAAQPSSASKTAKKKAGHGKNHQKGRKGK